MTRLLFLVVACLSLGAACKEPTRSSNPEHPEKALQVEMKAFDIIPGRAIGELRLGMARAELPERAQVSGSAGTLDGVSFELVDSVVDGVAGSVVDDVWIEDLRTFSGDARFKGAVLARDTPLEALKQLFGSCQQVDVKGGVFFNCSGVTLGSDAEATGRFVQIRLKPR